jgi:3-dehydroquinate synthase
MLDSAVGGKTGVNTGAGKNLVGAFHHPSHVLVDPEVLSTLDGRHLRAGLAEAVKAAAIADPELFGWMEERAGELARGRPEATARLVRRAVGIKADVVARDPEESGRRAVLNFGHTLGHALEAGAGYGGLHGEAVAAGMGLEARWGEERGVTEDGTAGRLRELARACGIRPWPTGDADPDALLAAARRDKKARRDEVRMVLLEGIGRVARPGERGWTHRVDEDRLRSWLPGALRSEGESTD